jgi:hypothetical protein
VKDTSSDGESRSRVVFEVTKLGKLKLSESLAEPRWASAKAPTPFSTWFGLSIHTSLRQRKKTLANRAVFLKSEIERKTHTIEFIRSYQSVRAQAGVDLVQLYIEQCWTELRWIENLESE